MPVAFGICATPFLISNHKHIRLFTSFENALCACRFSTFRLFFLFRSSTLSNGQLRMLQLCARKNGRSSLLRFSLTERIALCCVDKLTPRFFLGRIQASTLEYWTQHDFQLSWPLGCSLLAACYWRDHPSTRLPGAISARNTLVANKSGCLLRK